MKMIETTYSIGDKVEHFTGIIGMITAIFHRSGRNSYEMSYSDDGKPCCVSVEECEISIWEKTSLGFNNKCQN